MKKPFFSVIICSYNRRKLLVDALKSLRAQIFKDFEVIVVDDGSTDCTIKEMGNFPEIRYFYKKHSGVAEARNFGILKAKGEYVTFLDSDDVYLPQHLDSRYKYIVTHDYPYFLHGGFRTVGSQFVPDFYKKGEVVHVDKIILGPTFFIKNTLFKKVGNYRKLGYGEDTDFYNRLKQKKVRIYKVKDRTYIYQRHKDSITQKKRQADR
ncbi:MAG: glycosyltransferase family 2 protein [Candidatus Doudnabacteria bacterium]|nr:glycosyltransferase family 2 protein [Candidatus Doudnabacteria bacterium]